MSDNEIQLLNHKAIVSDSNTSIINRQSTALEWEKVYIAKERSLVRQKADDHQVVNIEIAPKEEQPHRESSVLKETNEYIVNDGGEHSGVQQHRVSVAQNKIHKQLEQEIQHSKRIPELSLGTAQSNDSYVPRTMVLKSGLNAETPRTFPAHLQTVVGRTINTKGYHLYLSEEGELHVWLRDKSLQSHRGEGVIINMRQILHRFGVNLAAFTLNGDRIYESASS